MGRLTALADLPQPGPSAVSPHAWRSLGDLVLLTNDWGAAAFVSADEYRRYLRGLRPGDPLLARLAAKGFVPGDLDLEGAAASLAERGPAGWRGPGRHRVRLDGGGERMTPETARRVVDFAFSCPGPVVRLDLEAGDPEACWPAARALARLAALRARWSRRAARVSLTVPGPLPPRAISALSREGVSARLALSVSGAPPAGPLPFPAAAASVEVGIGAREPEAWADWLQDGGAGEALWVPPREALEDEAALAGFLSFYERALDRLADPARGLRVKDSWALAFLDPAGWAPPGADVASELAYAPDGRVYTSLEGLALARRGDPALELGVLGALTWAALAEAPAARAALAALLPDHQPLCHQCAYRPYCSLPPGASLAEQGTLWGRTPESLRCALHMGLLDRLFARLGDGRLGPAREAWGLPEGLR